MARSATIGLIGAGAMGSGLGRLLSGNGVRVLSPLEGRSTPSLERAAKAGMESTSYIDLMNADLVVSVVPPAQARHIAEQFAHAGKGRAMPVFIDANAISPDTKCELQDIITSAGGRFVDGVIIGHPPREGYDGPRFYVSGEHADHAAILLEAGLDLRILASPVGSAAALKMCYGGFNKGITALTAAVLLAARRAGVDEALIAEFEISQQALLARSRSSVPGMYPKAYRWIAEFEEIAAFTADDQASSQIFAAMALFYADRADAHREGLELEALRELLAAERKSEPYPA